MLFLILVAKLNFDMVSKAEIKYIKSLQLKKNRDKEGVFVIEGAKNILELANSQLQIIKLLVTKDFYYQNEAKLSKLSGVVTITGQQIIESAGTFKTNQSGLALVSIEKDQNFEQNGWIIGLDRVQDPGNLGTIIRTADWFGIKQLICSKDTVDVYNTKVINATMGSFARVKVHYLDLNHTLPNLKIPIYGALLNGEPLHKVTDPIPGLILMGNESKGIDEKLISQISHPVMIPRVGGAESLNVAIATGILCAHFCL